MGVCNMPAGKSRGGKNGAGTAAADAERTLTGQAIDAGPIVACITPMSESQLSEKITWEKMPVNKVLSEANSWHTTM